MPRVYTSSRGFPAPVSYTEVGQPLGATQSAPRARLLMRGSDSTGQLVVTGGMGTNESPHEGFVFGWCGGTGATIALNNQLKIRIPRGARNWMRIRSINITPIDAVGCDFTPLIGVSDGGANTDDLALGEAKISTRTIDAMRWDNIDHLARIDAHLDHSIAETMGNNYPLTGFDPIPCITIEMQGYASVASAAFNFMVQLEWVEL